MNLALESPAKVNLFLRVLGRRADGYHVLETCFHGLAFGDELRAELAADGTELDLIDETATGLSIASGPDNLVCRAAEAFRAESGFMGGVRFTLRKRIPAGSGMGGGSSNAATALLLMNRLADSPLAEAALSRIGAGLGADVPFFLRGGTQIGGGVGDELTVVTPEPRLHFLLILPPFGVSTVAVYRQCRAPSLTADNDASRMRSAPRNWLSELSVPERFVNDLEKAAMELEPRLAKMRDRVVAAGYPHVRMSGSGSTLFLALHDAEHVARARADLADLEEAGVVLVATGSRVAREFGSGPGGDKGRSEPGSDETGGEGSIRGEVR